MKARPSFLRHLVSVAAALCATFATLVFIDALATRPMTTADSLAGQQPAAVAMRPGVPPSHGS